MTRTLQKGDLIGVSYSNFIFPAIYLQDTGKSIQFYLTYAEYYLEQIEKTISQNRKPYVNYINRKGNALKSPIVKMNYEDLSDEHKRLYDKCSYLLKQNNIL